ncbi:aldo/keto reductase [Gryllotalpicola kribbensis]|uniref:Aldo/keto reductase n=1 Tax=Gryllotalpicola kribbensis TaxID=993084 RepID=A0ABP8AGG3_9MICO
MRVSDYSPVAAREHLGHSSRGAAGRSEPDSDALFQADDTAATRPVPIIAERLIGETDLSAFPLTLGTARLATVDEVTAARILHRFVTRGGSLYDVGDDDGSGRSQELVGGWLAANRPHKIITMLTPSLQRDGGRASGAHRLVRAVHAALARLGRDRVDLLMLDFREAAGLGIAAGELLSAGGELITAGTVGRLGASGVTGAELLEARVLAGGGLPPIAAVRLEWSITDRTSHEAELRMAAAAQQLALLPDATRVSSALASPSLPQKVLAGRARSGKATQAVNARVIAPAPERAADVFAGRGREHRIGLALDRVSGELGVAPATSQLAWLLAKRGVVAPIVRVTRPEQVDTLMDAAVVRLTRAQMLELDRAVEAGR